MAGSHILSVDLVSERKQSLPLDVPVAGDAWIRRKSFDIRFDKRSRDMLSEFRQAVYVIKRYLKLSGYPYAPLSASQVLSVTPITW